MTTISNSASHARESARTAGGQFGEQVRTAPEIGLHTAPSVDIDVATDSAVAAMLWQSNEMDEHEEETGDRPEMSAESREYLRSELADFVAAHPDLIQAARDAGYTSSDGGGFEAALGHDFALTRERHGVGFWDRDALNGGLGAELTEAVQRRGEGDSLYVNDDGEAEFEFGAYRTERRETARAGLRALRRGGNFDAREAREVLKKGGMYTELSYQDRTLFTDIEDADAAFTRAADRLSRGAEDKKTHRERLEDGGHWTHLSDAQRAYFVEATA